MTREVIFARPYFSEADLDEITEKIRKILASGWLTSGKYTKQFEEEFGKYIGGTNAVAVNSCTAALHAILLALSIGPGDEVIVPSNTFVASANVALFVGARPVLVDADPDTFDISVDKVLMAMTPRTKAMVVVHVGGNPCDMNELLEIARDRKVHLIEDGAGAHGAKYQGRYCGTMGTAGAFSFYPTKIITTAEGGMVTSSDKQLCEKVRSIRNHGRLGFGPTENTDLGFNFRMPDVLAAIGLSQIRHLSGFVKRRNALAKHYSRGLKKTKWLQPQLVKTGNLSSYYAYILRLAADAPLTRDEFVGELKRRGVNTSVIYNPIHLQPLYRNMFKFKEGDFPVSESIGNNSIALPLGNTLNMEEADYVIETIRAIG